MLNHALVQSNWGKEPITEESWKAEVRLKLESLNWQNLFDDVQRFIIQEQELQQFTQQNIEALLEDS